MSCHFTTLWTSSNVDGCCRGQWCTLIWVRFHVCALSYVWLTSAEHLEDCVKTLWQLFRMAQTIQLISHEVFVQTSLLLATILWVQRCNNLVWKDLLLWAIARCRAARLRATIGWSVTLSWPYPFRCCWMHMWHSHCLQVYHIESHGWGWLYWLVRWSSTQTTALEIYLTCSEHMASQVSRGSLEALDFVSHQTHI